MYKRTTHNARRTTKSVYAVILVGGIGKRLQPLSKPSRPKPFLSITKDRKTIFRKTVDRVNRILPIENIIVVANKSQARLIRSDFRSIPKKNLILEKVSRNTAPAIALAALNIKKRDASATMIVLPADHYIGNQASYANTLKKAVEFVDGNPRAIVTIGLKPYFPSTNYGYIRTQYAVRSTRYANVYKVDKFVEKPDLKNAMKFVANRNYLWNAGTFIFKASTFLGAVRRLATDIYGAFKDVRRIEERYEDLPNISVDYAIMEKAYEIYCVKGSYFWEDIGSFDSLKKILKRERRRFLEKAGKVTKIL